MDITLKDSDFLGMFDLLIDDMPLDEYGKDKMNVYALKINANEFDYKMLEEQLIDPMIDYAVSRKVKRDYANSPGRLSKKARKEFKNYMTNDGELGELLLFCFLETHLNAPKILSKLELKTSTKLYVNGSDGVHFLKLDSGDYQLIFGESKMYEDIKSAFDEALKSIYEFKNEINSKGEAKSGIMYEKSLISDNLLKETFSEEEYKFLRNLIYPSKGRKFYVDDAFGIFIGFEIKISEEEKALPNSMFRELIHTRIKDSVKECLDNIKKKIKNYNLQGHNFYIYVLPFTDIEKNRRSILGEVLA